MRIESLKNNEFKNVYNYGKSVANSVLILYTLSNTFDRNRLGICASKSVGNSVIRHRAIRIIREAYMKVEKSIPVGYDLVVIARKPIIGKKTDDIMISLIHLFKRAGINI